MEGTSFGIDGPSESEDGICMAGDDGIEGGNGAETSVSLGRLSPPFVRIGTQGPYWT